MARSHLGFFPLILLAACGDQPVADNSASTYPDAPDAGRDQQATSPTPAPEPAAANDDDAAVPPVQSRDFADNYVISTNEPFHQAVIGPRTVVLRSAGAAKRVLTIESETADTDSRQWRARDARGTVAATIANRPCTDDMSAASFPFSGTLSFGTAPVRGCARPEGVLPAQPDDGSAADAGEAEEAAMPPRFHGRWAPDQAGCADPASTIEAVTIAANEIRWHESIAVPTAIKPNGRDDIRVTAAFDGEGQQWNATHRFRLSGDGDRLDIEGQRQRIRCG